MSSKVIAVSGGVDSVVLLHMIAQAGDEVVVAHVDHGIRDDSADDARFVAGLASSYGFRFKQAELSLGSDASEDLARRKRYQFLFDITERYEGVLCTAHHADDLAETIAINLHRGTGWRGLCVLSRQGIERPLLNMTKQDIYDYALRYGLEYVEDKTNHDLRYLRNKIRSQLSGRLNDEARRKLKDLRHRQLQLRSQIADEMHSLTTSNGYSRHFLTQLPNAVALEVLGELIRLVAGRRPVGKQLERALMGIKTAKAGTKLHVGDKIILGFTTRFFSVEML